MNSHLQIHQSCPLRCLILFYRGYAIRFIWEVGKWVWENATKNIPVTDNRYGCRLPFVFLAATSWLILLYVLVFHLKSNGISFWLSFNIHSNTEVVEKNEYTFVGIIQIGNDTKKSSKYFFVNFVCIYFNVGWNTRGIIFQVFDKTYSARYTI